MKIVESWLREWVDPGLDTEALAYRLTMAGHEVDGIELEVVDARETLLMSRLRLAVLLDDDSVVPLPGRNEDGDKENPR